MSLYYVDDQENTLAIVQAALNVAGHPLPLREFVGRDAPDRFWRELRTARPSAGDAFLLDVNMPAGSRLKRVEGIWHFPVADYAHVCGIALARGLVHHCAIPLGRIALLTHMDHEEPLHQATLVALELHGIEYIGKHQTPRLQQWLKGLTR